ncbi:hypothetical protein FPRO04_14211 [Fusarium proliferatum]|nr:hypothetical protein FPRO04_14211 [Fusarium proliferatum]
MNPENDPCDYGHHTSASTSPRHQPYDSDPEEADIDEHTHTGFILGRNPRVDPDHPHHHHDPAFGLTLDSFFEMLNRLGPLAPGRNGSFPSGRIEREQPAEQNFGPRIHRISFIHGITGGGTSPITMTVESSHATRTGSPAGQAEASQEYAQPLLQRPERPSGLRVTAISMTVGANQRTSFLRNFFRNVGIPPPLNEIRDGTEGAGDAPAGLAQSLTDILNMLSSPNGAHGDAVYSREAIDRIITNLMEANAHSKAAPPATEEALKSLVRKPVDKDMLGSEGKAGCTICIDEMKEGNMATFLPCNHWYHEECVTLWLKEHNTCPICRTPIEKTDRTGDSSSDSN